MRSLTFFMLFLVPALALGQVKFVRNSTSEWYVENQSGEVLSNHTRLDKAFQAAANRAIENGQIYIVRGGSYRVEADLPQVPPEVIITAPDDDVQEFDDVGEIFGPVSSPTVYAASEEFRARTTRWQVIFSTDDPASRQGLVSRDESGQSQAGHLSVWIENQRLRLRNQPLNRLGSSVQLTGTTPLESGQEYTANISISDSGISLHIDGVLQETSTVAYTLDGNDLPLVVGGSCSRCSDGEGVDSPINGSVSLEIFPDIIETPITSYELRWTHPVERIDNSALPIEEIAGTALWLYDKQIATVEGDVDGYEYVAVNSGEHCFSAATIDNFGQRSERSTPACLEK